MMILVRQKICTKSDTLEAEDDPDQPLGVARLGTFAVPNFVLAPWSKHHDLMTGDQRERAADGITTGWQTTASLI